jgi:hypothetical protein
MRNIRGVAYIFGRFQAESDGETPVMDYVSGLAHKDSSLDVALGLRRLGDDRAFA